MVATTLISCFSGSCSLIGRKNRVEKMPISERINITFINVFILFGFLLAFLAYAINYKVVIGNFE